MPLTKFSIFDSLPSIFVSAAEKGEGLGEIRGLLKLWSMNGAVDPGCVKVDDLQIHCF